MSDYDERGETDWDPDPHGAEPSARRPFADWGGDGRGAWRATDEGPRDRPQPGDAPGDRV